nr:hypothetical protein CFP56_02213 [Quercus suber]
MGLSLDLRSLSPFRRFYFRHAADRANFVDNVLLLHRASKLTNFSVEVEYNPKLKPRVDLWVRFATTAKVLSIMSVKHLSSPVSPYVETLVIDIIFSNHDSEFLDRIYDEVNHWKSKEVYFKALLQCLTTVKIFGFGERFHTKDVFILVVEFLLKNAKVDQLSLCLSAPHLNPYGNDGYTLLQHLYADEFVSELDFHFCEIKPKGLVGWSSLKCLCIGYTALSEDVINKALMGSPRLEFLKLQNFIDFNRFDILSESLRKLVIDSCYSKCHELIELEIMAPKIESLEIQGNFYGKRKCEIKGQVGVG